MPFALITIGLMILVTALNNTWRQFGQQVYKDVFTESGGFLYWVAALVIVGFMGYIPQLRKPADAFLVLILVAMLLKNGGVFAQFQQGLATGVLSGGLQTGASGASGANSGSPTGNASMPFDLTNLNLPVYSNSTPLTTPAPAAQGQSIPLGFGGIGSA